MAFLVWNEMAQAWLMQDDNWALPPHHQLSPQVDGGYHRLLVFPSRWDQVREQHLHYQKPTTIALSASAPLWPRVMRN